MSSHLDRLEALAADVACYRLVYADLEDVMHLLRQTCADGKPFYPAVRTEDEAVVVTSWKKDPTVFERVSFGHLYLYRNHSFDIINVNETAIFILRMIEEELSADEMLALMVEAFPDVDAETLTMDLHACLRDLQARAIIVPN